MAHDKLTRTFLMLTKKWLNIKRFGGLMTHNGFNHMFKKPLLTNEIVIHENKFNIKKPPHFNNMSPVNNIIINATYSDSLTEPGRVFIFGSTPYERIKDLKKIYGFVVHNNDVPFLSHNFEARLSCDSFDILEVQIGVQQNNLKQPKRLFKT